MEADLDKDGKISFEEFTKMVENTDVSMSMTLGRWVRGGVGRDADGLPRPVLTPRVIGTAGRPRDGPCVRAWKSRFLAAMSEHTRL